MCAAILSTGCDRPAIPSNDNAVTRAGAEELSKKQISELTRAEGQRVYVPVYSHIYHMENEVFDLTGTLSIRNIDEHASLYIQSVKYYDTAGKLLREYAKSPVRLPPLATLEYIIGVGDTEGGSGANFIVEWMSDRPLNDPIIECVMIGTQSQQGVSFISSGKVLE